MFWIWWQHGYDDKTFSGKVRRLLHHHQRLCSRQNSQVWKCYLDHGMRRYWRPSSTYPLIYTKAASQMEVAPHNDLLTLPTLLTLLTLFTLLTILRLLKLPTRNYWQQTFFGKWSDMARKLVKSSSPLSPLSVTSRRPVNQPLHPKKFDQKFSLREMAWNREKIGTKTAPENNF